MKTEIRLAGIAAALVFLNVSEAEAQTYSNPVLRRDCPDPTLLDDRARSGYFYVYSTQSQRDGNATASRDASADRPEDIINLPIYRSRNLMDWEFAADGFAEGRPDWVRDTRIWAPDINYVDGHYQLYYALGAWAQIFREGSGVAVSDSPEGPFRDLGEVVSFKSTGVTNSIDPALFIDDDGKKYLFIGKRFGGCFDAPASGCQVELPVDARRFPFYRLVVDNGGSAPLETVRLLGCAERRRIVFESRAPELILAYGGEAAVVRPESRAVGEVNSYTAGPEEPNPAYETGGVNWVRWILAAAVGIMAVILVSLLWQGYQSIVK